MSDFRGALDPARSAVVEACAGSGKTWLLASRIVRLLLAGSAPGEILAITFTRKAAREIEERVVGWLRDLALGDDAAVAAFLTERDLAPTPERLRAARGLYERVSGDAVGLAVNTFHGWFLQLVAAAPLSANLAGASLVEAGSRLFEELWQSFAVVLQAAPDGEPARAFVDLLGRIGLDSTRNFLRRAADRRAEWLAYTDGAPDPVAMALADLKQALGVGESETALADFFAPGWAMDFQAYLGFLEQSELETDARAAGALAVALADGDADPESRFAAIRNVVLTATGSLRARKLTKALIARHTEAGATRFIDLHTQLGGRLIDCEGRRIEEGVYAFNRQALTLYQAFLAHFERFKADRRQIDFIDAEWRVLQLLREEETAAFLQARLDARYGHVLLDEFQDTNPLQWQILLAWLDAYSDAARPTVFLVGDPKQSIYRFRRAEPRLFSAAADFLGEHFAALRLSQDATRRNARPIVDVVNALFGAEPAFVPFREQTSLAEAPGRVELLPLCGEVEEEAGAAIAAFSATDLRDPLVTPEAEVVDGRRRAEAEQVAARIGEIVGRWQVVDGGEARPARYGDIMLLARRRTQLAEYERALRSAGIPYAAASRGGLLTTLEVSDLAALLEFLVTPVADLQLAQALKSPLFACRDDELLALAAASGGTWWERLQAIVAVAPTPRLARAARLLAAWRDAADRLPVHDLLDRIFAEGELLARYRAAVPEALAAGVEANLEALLLLALDLDGGRYPSLPRFIDELRALRDAEADDAPDEGTIDDAGEAGGGRVRILTVHGAKGLEAPVVWLLDANAATRGDEPYAALVDWPPETARPCHFSFYGRKEERGEARQPMFDAEARAAEREELNLLYVAVTRAKQVFIASGIASDRTTETTPYRRLERALKTLAGDAGAYGDVLPAVASAAPPAAAAPAEQPPEPVPIGERRFEAEAGERFGILFHALLERRTGEVGEAAGWWRDLGFDDADHERAAIVAGRLLAAPGLARFFSAKAVRRAWNEVELCTAAGAVCRIDRLVEFDAEIWVLDYKSGGAEGERLDDYRQQVAGYCAAVTRVRPDKPVRGALVFADGTLLEVGT